MGNTASALCCVHFKGNNVLQEPRVFEWGAQELFFAIHFVQRVTRHTNALRMGFLLSVKVKHTTDSEW